MANPFEKVLSTLVLCQVSLPDLIRYVLDPRHCNVVYFRHQVVGEAANLCEQLMTASAGGHQIILDAMGQIYLNEVSALTDIDGGLHFSAANASIDQISSFNLPAVAKEIRSLAPRLWSFLWLLLNRGEKDLVPTEPSLQESYSESLEEIIDEIMDSPKTRKEKRKIRKAAILTVRTTVVTSIIMHTYNQKANSLQGLYGLFLHSCGTPERVVSSLARAGLSVSQPTIYRMIGPMSDESAIQLYELGQTKLVMYAADNFDVNMKHHVSTADRGGDKLYHLTSAVILPLLHGVTLADLKCSDMLWKNSRLNPENGDTAHAIHVDESQWKTLLTKLYGQTQTQSGELTRREQFTKWKYLYDLLYHGPEYFREFIPLLKEPVAVEKIPVKETPIYPARAMDCNNSTVSGNIAALEQLAKQGGIGDTSKDKNAVDISEYVTIVHGDLGTGDRIASILLRRSIESTPWRRFQHVVFVPGNFHLKLACADAIYRLTLQKSEARLDITSLMRDISILHPKHSGSYSSPKVTYRQMNTVIINAGIVRRLDMWLSEAKKEKPNLTDLEGFANLKPTWEKLQVMAESLARSINSDNKVGQQRRRPGGEPERDEQHENSILLMKYFMLYEELAYAMNHGDIGRLELALIQWIFIFKGVGKNKYALHMQRFLIDLHLNYPEGLRRAIRYNSLVNLKGKRDTFRAVDWVVELMNLYTKTIYGGDGSNHTIERILKESPLVMAYRDAHNVVEKNFVLRKLTTAHSGPDMAASFEAATAALGRNRAHEVIPGRKSKYSIINAIDVGRGKLNNAKGGLPVGMDVDEGDVQVDELDILSEIT